MDEIKVPRHSVNIEDEMRQSFLDYAMSVIISRALPDARDGLKPVHRRVLYGMYEIGVDWNRAYKKSARVVGDVMGKYHPHGDAAIYDTIARMAQDFSLRYPLIDGQGNFGSIDGDPPAAMRYTEVRMSRIASEMLADIEKETVEFVPNYDETTREPRVLPAKIPNLLVNGSSGIAVGMATNVPPHNLREIVDAVIALVERPDITIDELMEIVPGPDFPTGGILCGRRAIADAYRDGKGILTVRARAAIETDEKRDRQSIIVTEIPFQVNKARLIERMAELVNEKTIEGISDLRDESDRDGMRIVIELKRDAVAGVVLNQLYRHTPMQDSFGVILLAIVENRPVTLNLKTALRAFLDHRRDVVTRRTQYELREAEKRLHVLEGFRIALDHLDQVIALIRASSDPAAAKAGLTAELGLSEIQAQEILNLRLQRLTSLERDKILKELAETQEEIRRYREILGSAQEVDRIIVAELRDVQKLYGDERRTQILDERPGDFRPEDLIVEEDMVVTISHRGYIKRIPATAYRAQRRGGRGKIGSAPRDEDFIAHLFIASTHSYLLFFTSTGRVHWLKVHEVPQAGRASRGKPIVNLLHLGAEEKISAFLPVREFHPGSYACFATRRGLVKKTDLMAYANPRSSGLIAIAVEDGDEVIGVRETDGAAEIILSTKTGQAIRFSEHAVRATGRDTYGVKGVSLEEGDEVVAMAIVDPHASLLAMSELGFGKRTGMDEYRVTNRGGKGIITMRVTERTGPVVGVLTVTDDDQAMLVTSGGKVIRMRVAEIRQIGRNTQGVRLIGIDEGERVVAVARLAERDDVDAAANGNGAANEDGVGNGVGEDDGDDEAGGDPV
ncbi:MAG: gyrase subunit [Candidatus Binatota bacterium]|jgi:DNA gyrase subunit A|nr:gyrase subunit [Candidatus Binatota bacterium]